MLHAMADLDRRKTIAALDRNGFAGRSRLPWRCARAAGLAGALVIACGIATILYLRGLAQELDGSPTGKVNHDVTVPDVVEVDGEQEVMVAAEALSASQQSWVDARKGLVPWGGAGPRPPSNEREIRLSEIPVYRPEEDVVFYSHIHKTSGTSLSVLLANIFPRDALVPTSHPSKGIKVAEISGHDEDWWKQYQVMYGHNRPNITDSILFPPTKRPRLLLTVRNPLLHKASIFFESICRFGLHIKNGVIDQEEATMARMQSKVVNREMYAFCRDPEEWVDSPQFFKIYRNFQANWLSYGGAERHPCIAPNLELNMWMDNAYAGDCADIRAEGREEAIWQEYFDRSADAAILRLEDALWVGVTERMEEASCLLFLTLGKESVEMGTLRLKEPRPITVWHEKAIAKAAVHDKADWRVFEAANDILDLRLWTARERLRKAGEEEREGLGRCFDVIMAGDSPTR